MLVHITFGYWSLFSGLAFRQYRNRGKKGRSRLVSHPWSRGLLGFDFDVRV